jgi:hypothetical protein
MLLPSFWHFIIRGCLLWCGLPRVSLLEASLAYKEPPPGGANKWALEPFAPGVGEVPYPIVSCWLRDLAERVDIRASCPLNGRMT